MYRLHIGVHKMFVEQVTAALTKHPAIEGRVYASGNGWESWDEGPDDEENAAAPDARHIAIDTDDLETGIRAVRETAGHLLIPMGWGGDPVVLVVTDGNDPLDEKVLAEFITL